MVSRAQGTHPGLAGQSVLNYLLSHTPSEGSESTEIATVIPNQYGIFLNQSYRLTPQICHFISQAFYQNLLTSHPLTSTRRLDLSRSNHSNLPLSHSDPSSNDKNHTDSEDRESGRGIGENVRIRESGIGVIPVWHEGCSAQSEYEADVIRTLYHRLLQGEHVTVRDRNLFSDQNEYENEKKREIGIDDILVLSPYNAQVAHLKTVLPEGAHVGNNPYAHILRSLTHFFHNAC